jgi:beta-glucosidase
MKKVLVAIAILCLIYIGAVLSFRDPDMGLNFNRDDLRRDSLRFGKDFLWGSSTSAYQVEGNCTNNNWYLFESETDEQGRPRIAGGQKCGLAADHWNRYKEDIQLMKSLHLNAYRFSVEWSRIEPAEGVFADTALDHYERVVDELRANGIEPLITLHHFTNPIWFEKNGAFLQENSPELLTRYAEKVVKRLGPKVRFWSTINEPSVYALNGYFLTEFPPAVRDPAKASVVFRNLLRSHAHCYKRIKEIRADAEVGLLVNIYLFDPPSSWNLLDVTLARYLNKDFSTAILDFLNTGVFDFSLPGIASEHFDSGLRDTYDYVGLNYYTRFRYRFDPISEQKLVEVQHLPPSELTDRGWEIYPEGLYRALKMISSRTSKPIYITENGIADDRDSRRAGFIEDHLLITNRAIADGMNIKGYFYWSLLDNFELAKGFDVRFGLYAVNYATQERTLRSGSKKYSEIVLRATRAAQ